SNAKKIEKAFILIIIANYSRRVNLQEIVAQSLQEVIHPTIKSTKTRMSLYPSLEDMKVDQMARAQVSAITSGVPPQTPPAYSSQPASNGPTNTMYPALVDYMGLELSEAVIAANMPEYSQVAVYQRSEIVTPALYSNMVAPLSSQSLGLQKAQVTNGVREVI
ncbi:hypothetical protein AMK59_7751, partial [Oryctes borbonicus]